MVRTYVAVPLKVTTSPNTAGPYAVNPPPTLNVLPIPTPPATVNALPIFELVLDTVFRIEIILVVLLPRLVTLCNVLVLQIVMSPAEVLTAVSVPAVIVV